MTLLVQRDGRLYFSAGSLARLAISGQDIDDDLDIALADIKVLGRNGDVLIINSTKYPHCGKAFNDIMLSAKAQGINIPHIGGIVL